MRRIPFVAIILILFSYTAAVAASHADLFPLMTNISGWDAEESSGNTMPGMMVNASRQYSKAGSTFTLTIMKSKMAAGAFGGVNNTQSSTSEAAMKVETINGFKVTGSFDKTTKEGCYIVSLAPGSMITLCFENLAFDMGKTILMKFNWKKIQATLNAIP